MVRMINIDSHVTTDPVSGTDGIWAPILCRGDIRTRSPAQADRSGDGFPGIKASPVAGPREFDEAKKVDGVKRHALVGTTCVLVAAADVADRAAFPRCCPRRSRLRRPSATCGWTRATQAGLTTAAAKASGAVDMVSGPKPGHGFIVQPRRSVVEHTNGSIYHCRHNDRHYETAHGRPRTLRLPQPNHPATPAKRIPYFYLGTTRPRGHSVSVMTVACEEPRKAGLFPSPPRWRPRPR